MLYKLRSLMQLISR